MARLRSGPPLADVDLSLLPLQGVLFGAILKGKLNAQKTINIEWCTLEGCERPASSLGLCQYHYNKKRLAENPNKAYSGLRGHPFYIIWWQRKQGGELCERWLDFENFVWDISPKPEGEFYLVKLRNEPFGPTNFKWHEHLRRKKDESAKDWNARQRANRIAANPRMESDRNIKRRFGITREQYDEKLKSQNGGCAICGQKETALNGVTGTIKLLAVDHCHTTNKVRALLCGRCNTTLGKVDDNIELLQSMIDYLTKHKELQNG